MLKTVLLLNVVVKMEMEIFCNILGGRFTNSLLHLDFGDTVVDGFIVAAELIALLQYLNESCKLIY